MISDTILSVDPHSSKTQIPRDAQVRQIANKFDRDCQHLMVIGGPQTGKTDLLKQFAEYHAGQSIHVEIDESPWTQQQHAFLYPMCQQLSEIIGNSPPPVDIKTEELKNLFTTLCYELIRLVKQQKKPYFFVVDGLEWAIEGTENSRIIDLFPLRTNPTGLYLLCSCRSDKVYQLPEVVRKYQTIEPLSFGSHETELYLEGPQFTKEEIQVIHQKYNGIPGYLRIIRNTKLNNPAFNLETAPPELEELIDQEVEWVLEASDQLTREALNYLAVSPLPLRYALLAYLVDRDKDDVIIPLQKTGLVSCDNEKLKAKYSNEMTRQRVLNRIGDDRKKVINRLIKTVRSHYPDEDFLLTMLLREGEDYEGIQELLRPSKVLSTMESTGDISSVIRRLQIAAEYARERDDPEGLLRCTFGSAVAKSFIIHAINQNEIEALQAIGASQEAISKAYLLPEKGSKIRTLARTYTLMMKEKGERIPKSAKEELEAMVEDLNAKDMDKELARKIAIDLFPILPDSAMALLEKVSKKVDKQSLVEVAVGVLVAEAQEERESAFLSVFKKQGTSLDVLDLFSSWLGGKSLSELSKELTEVENTEAKEFLLRQWCQQNNKSSDLTEGVKLWLKTVIDDRDFVVSLKALRQMAEVMNHVPNSERKELIERLRISSFVSLDSPKEEWVRFRLNLVEALFEIDSVEAQTEVKDIYDLILKKAMDLDARSYCFARLWATLSKLMPNDHKFVNEVMNQFNDSFNALLADSADHFDLIRETIHALVEVDPTHALLIVSELNTRERRYKATRVVLITALRQKGEEELSQLVRDVFGFLTQEERDVLLKDLLIELSVREVSLSRSNLDVLREYVNQIQDYYYKSMSLSHLAVLFYKVSASDSCSIMKEGVEAWRQENDLILRLSLGYQLVKNYAKIEMEQAKRFYEEVKRLQLEPSGSLASGRLATAFIESIEFAIRTLNMRDFSENDSNIQKIEKMIIVIPSRLLRVKLYAKLAGSAYRTGYSPRAQKIVQTLIGELEKLNQTDQSSVLEYSLPVILEYDFSTAERLAERLSESIQNMAWYSTILWKLSGTFLGDQLFDPRELRLSSNYPDLEKALFALEKISYDSYIYQAIIAISNAVELSFDSHINLSQGLDILQRMEQFAKVKLPDHENIRHEGYLVICLSGIHRVRSMLYQKAKFKRGLDKKDITKGWKTLCDQAKCIRNTADRVFVMALVAQDIVGFYKKDLSVVRSLLNEAYNDVGSIPTISDRFTRLGTIAESWRLLGQKDQAEYIMKLAFDMVKEMSAVEADRRLSMLVQAAYKISPDLAEEFASKLDRGINQPVFSPTQIAIQVEKLRRNPAQINSLLNTGYLEEIVLDLSANQLLAALVTGKGTIPHIDILLDWLMKSLSLPSRPSKSVTDWVLESMYQKRKQDGAYHSVYSTISLETAEIAYQLAKWIDPTKETGIPEAVRDSFPGLSSKFKVFGVGEVERAKRWLQNWLRNNAKEYLKICDPYFGIPEIEYLRYVPADCKVQIITSDHFFKNGNVIKSIDEIKNELERHWEHITTQLLPAIYLLILPQKDEKKFHDRAIVTRDAGLDLGQSLNGLGKSQGKISILLEEDAKELERDYVDKILNQSTWFMQGIKPTMIMFERGH